MGLSVGRRVGGQAADAQHPKEAGCRGSTAATSTAAGRQSVGQAGRQARAASQQAFPAGRTMALMPVHCWNMLIMTLQAVWGRGNKG